MTRQFLYDVYVYKLTVVVNKSLTMTEKTTTFVIKCKEANSFPVNISFLEVLHISGKTKEKKANLVSLHFIVIQLVDHQFG